jgi:hypothetical protein
LGDCHPRDHDFPSRCWARFARWLPTREASSARQSGVAISSALGVRIIRAANEQIVFQHAQPAQGVTHRGLAEAKSLAGTRHISLLHHRVEQDEQSGVDCPQFDFAGGWLQGLFAMNMSE